MNKRNILLNIFVPLGCVAVTTAIILPLLLTSRGVIVKTMDGSDWGGRTNGTLVGTPDDDNHTITYKTQSTNFKAENLVIPEIVTDPSSLYKVYKVICIGGATTTTDGKVTPIPIIETENIKGTITFPKTITSIGTSAFEGCNHLTGNIILPSKLTTINQNSFKGCSGITGISLGNDITYIGSNSFLDCSALLNDDTSIAKDKICCDENLIYYIFNGKYSYCLGKGDNVNSSVKTTPSSLSLRKDTLLIADHAFAGCATLTEDISFPDTLSVIDSGAFNGCAKICKNGTLTWSKFITTIGSSIFNSCTSITHIVTNYDKKMDGTYNFNSAAFTGLGSTTGGGTIHNQGKLNSKDVLDIFTSHGLNKNWTVSDTQEQLWTTTL